MDDDRPTIRNTDHAALLAGDDLDKLSAGEIDARIGLLKDEIARCEARKAAAGSTRSAAEALFRSP